MAYKNYKAGEHAELLAKSFFEKHGWAVEDVRAVREFQNQDIDFIIYAGEKKRKVEVKSDSYLDTIDPIAGFKPRHTFFIEWITDLFRNKWGWIQYTQADLICYVAEKTERIFIFRPAEMREYIQKNRDRITIKLSKEPFDAGEISIGAIVDYEDYKAQDYKLWVYPQPYEL